MTDIASTHEGPTRPRPRYRRFLGAGASTGLLGSICCVGSAIAVGAGVSGLSFFTTWMSQYRIFFIAASIAIMTAWLIHIVRRQGTGQGLKAAARQIWRHAVTMAAVYAVTLLAGMAVSGIVGTG